MLFTPFNFAFSLQRVAVYEWEPVPPAEDPPPVLTPATCADAESQAQQQRQDSLPPAMQLVFKGYEWASVAACSSFPRPSFEDCYLGGSDVANQRDSPESERRARHNEAVRRAKPAAAALEQANAADDSRNTPAPSDPLKSRQRWDQPQLGGVPLARGDSDG